MKKSNWKGYTIANSYYSKSIYAHHILIQNGGFFVANRLFKGLTDNLKLISIVMKRRKK